MYLNHLPTPGETVGGGKLATHLGGKGANQAVACLRAGAEMRFISTLGNDTTGNTIKAQFEEIGLSTEYMTQIPGATTGTACIFIDDNAENCIGLTAGANALLDEAMVASYQGLIADADYLLMQLETPLPSIMAAARLAQASNTAVVLNPAPTMSLPNALLPLLDIVTPNQGELAQLTAMPTESEDQIEAAAQALLAKGIGVVVVTMGSQGVGLFTETASQFFAAKQVDALDTTAAGDTFNGFFVARLAQGDELAVAIRMAADAASLSVTRAGAIPSIPHWQEVAG